MIPTLYSNSKLALLEIKRYIQQDFGLYNISTLSWVFEADVRSCPIIGIKDSQMYELAISAS